MVLSFALRGLPNGAACFKHRDNHDVHQDNHDCTHIYFDVGTAGPVQVLAAALRSVTLHPKALGLTVWLQQSCVPAHLVELCCIDVLHAGANLAPLPHAQLAVAPEHALQVVIGRRINWHGRRLAPCNNAALPGSLSVVPADSNQCLCRYGSQFQQ